MVRGEAVLEAWSAFGALFAAKYDDDWDGALTHLEDVLSQFILHAESGDEDRKIAVDLHACLAGLRRSVNQHADGLFDV